MDVLAAKLGRGLVHAMTMDVWHQVLRVFADTVADTDPEAATMLKADLRATQRRLMEDPDHGDPRVQDEYTASVTVRLGDLLGEKPELRLVLASIDDSGLLSSAPSAEQMRSESTGIQIGFQNVGGNVVLGGMTQNINRDQVRDS